MDSRKLDLRRAVAVLAIGTVVALGMVGGSARGAADGLSGKEKRQGDRRWLGAADANSFLRDTVLVMSSNEPVDPDDFGFARADCPSGYQVLSGGVYPESVFTMVVTASTPVIGTGPFSDDIAPGTHDGATGWLGYVRNNDAEQLHVQVSAICAKGT